METFDSKKTSLYEILRDLHKGKIQLPDFQRGWVWDDNRIKGIIASVAKSFPIGAVMLLESGNESIRFKTKAVEGAPESNQPYWLARLKSINDALSQEEKLAIVQTEFEGLYDPSHPMHNTIETLHSIEEVGIIKEALK
ncbi:MAG: DUF262 domain-containing protein [Bacteroidales bacterium]|nr:DUF262 domain-containing protein [Bacteroidales bacterium]MCF8377230.1 DUF262 domain-containing protein [Bacteroidales bacterium]